MVGAEKSCEQSQLIDVKSALHDFYTVPRIKISEYECMIMITSSRVCTMIRMHQGEIQQ